MLVSKNVFVRGHRTSMRLEPEMWDALVEIASVERMTLHELVTQIAEVKGVNLTSAVRCFVIAWYVRRCEGVDAEPAVRSPASARATAALSLSLKG